MHHKRLLTRIAFPLMTFAGGITVGAMFHSGAPTTVLQVAEHSHSTASSASIEGPRGNAAAQGSADSSASQPDNPARNIAPTTERVPLDDASEGSSTLGDLSISGTIVDWKGQPLSGVTVRVVRHIQSHPTTSSDSEVFEPWDTLEKEVADLAANYSRRAASRGEATSTADGTYRIDGLSAGSYQVEARARGYALRPSGRGLRASAGSTLNFRADGVSEIPLTITRSDGGPVPEAVIALTWLTKGYFDNEERLWQATHPVLALTQERYTLTARLDTEHARRLNISGEWASAEVEVEVIAGADPDPVHLTLLPRSGVRGRVLVPPDLALDYVHLKLTPIDSSDSTDAAAPWSLSGPVLSTHRYSGYTFEFLDVEPGHYQILVSRDGRGTTGVDAVPIELTGGIVERDVPLPELDLHEAILIYAKDARDRPIDDNLSVYMRVKTPETENTEAMIVVPQAPGIYTASIPGAYQGIVQGTVPSMTSATVTVVARYGDLGEVSATLQRGQREVRLTFADPARLYLTVLGLENSGGVTSIQATLTGSVQRSSTILEANKSALLGPAQPGPASLQLIAVSGAGRYTEVFTDTVDLIAGANHRTITLPTLHTLHVRIPDSLTPVTSVRLSAETPAISYQGELKDGSAHFAGLLPGRYRLHVWDNATAVHSMSVQIPTVADIEFVADGDSH